MRGESPPTGAEWLRRAYARRMALLERERLLAFLGEDLARVVAGAGRLVLVGGEAGSGKTALVQCFASGSVSTGGGASTNGVEILWGLCDPIATPRPLGPLADIAPGLGGEVSDLVRSGRRDAAFAEALRCLVSRSRPVVLVFEDLHWADESTLDFVRFLARRIQQLRVLLICTFRDDVVGAASPLRLLLGDLAGGGPATRLAVPPLSVMAVAELASSHRIDATALFERTGGNAFLVTEMMAAADQAGGGGLPSSVTDAVLARVARLSRGAQELIGLAGVVGVRAETAVLLRLEGADAAALDECVSHGVLGHERMWVSFRHALVRDVVVAAMPPAAAARRHADVLRVLSGLPAVHQPFSRMAHHAEAAGDGGAVLRYAVAAGDAARRLKSHREAASQYALALRFSDGADAVLRAGLLEKSAYEYYLVDQIPDAMRTAARAVEAAQALGEPQRLARCLRALSRMVWSAGRRDEALSAAAQALAVVEHHPGGHEEAMAFSTWSTLMMVGDDAVAAIEWGHRALAAADACADREARAHALNSVGTARCLAGDPGGETLLLESLRIAVEDELEDDAARAWTNLTAVCVMTGDYETASRYVEEGIAYCQDRDLHSMLRCLSSDRTRLAFRRGNWDLALAEATAGVNHPGVSALTKVALQVVLGLAAARRGTGDPWEVLDQAWRTARRSGELQFLVPVAAARAECRWLSGQPDRIRGEAGATYDLARRLEHGPASGELALWLWRADALDSVPPCPEPFAAQLAGDWAAAHAWWRSVGFDYDAAMAATDGDDVAALVQALATFELLGARPMAARTARRLRGLGATALPRGPRASTRRHPAGLTAREAEILDLIGLGLTNAEIAARLVLSPRTVAHHVSGILAKLQVKTRRDAARSLARSP